jgi:hypothetical protein
MDENKLLSKGDRQKDSASTLSFRIKIENCDILTGYKVIGKENSEA